MSLKAYFVAPLLARSCAVMPGTHQCFGPQCFRTTFLVLAGFCASGVATAVLLTHRIVRRTARRETRDDKLTPLNG